MNQVVKDQAKPILFNTEMVRAILEGRKTVTRRVIKPQPICYGHNITFPPHDSSFFLPAEKHWLRCRECGHDPEYSREGSSVSHHWEPPYQPGDILYVRETWTHHEGAAGGIIFKARCPERLANNKKWRPSIHMPKEAARIFLRVTDVRVERLQDITPEGAILEGVEREALDEVGGEFALGMFSDIWDSTIKPADRDLYSWAANPWVWVVEFERVERNEKTEV